MPRPSRGLSLCVALCLCQLAWLPTTRAEPEGQAGPEADEPRISALAELDVTSTEVLLRYDVSADEESRRLVVRGRVEPPAKHGIIGYRTRPRRLEVEGLDHSGNVVALNTQDAERGRYTPRRGYATLYMALEDLEQVPRRIESFRGEIDWLIGEESQSATFAYTDEPESDQKQVRNEWLIVYVDEAHRYRGEEDETGIDLTLRYEIKERPPGELTPSAIERFYSVALLGEQEEKIGTLRSGRDAGTRMGMRRLMYSFRFAGDQKPATVQITWPTKLGRALQTFEAETVPLAK